MPGVASRVSQLGKLAEVRSSRSQQIGKRLHLSGKDIRGPRQTSLGRQHGWCKHDKGGTHRPNGSGKLTRGPRASWASAHSRIRKPNLWTSPARNARGRPPPPRHHTPTAHFTSGDVRRSPPDTSKPSQPVRPTIPDQKSPLARIRRLEALAPGVPVSVPGPCRNPSSSTNVSYLPNRRRVLPELSPCQRRRRPPCLLTWNATWSL